MAAERPGAARHGKLFSMAGTLARVATCNLNQWAMDFEGNLSRIEASIRACERPARRGPPRRPLKFVVPPSRQAHAASASRAEAPMSHAPSAGAATAGVWMLQPSIGVDL